MDSAEITYRDRYRVRRRWLSLVMLGFSVGWTLAKMMSAAKYSGVEIALTAFLSAIWGYFVLGAALSLVIAFVPLLGRERRSS